MSQISLNNNDALEAVAEALNLDIDGLMSNTMTKFTLEIDFQKESPVVSVEYTPVEKEKVVADRLVSEDDIHCIFQPVGDVFKSACGCEIIHEPKDGDACYECNKPIKYMPLFMKD